MKGETILITGATDGIGKAAALALSHTGAHLVLLVRSEDRREAMGRLLPQAECIVCDLSSLAAIQEAVATFKQKHTSLHTLIHVAGVMPVHQELSKDGIELTQAVNYFAPVLLTELLLPILRESAPSRIIAVTSHLYKRGHIDLAHVTGAPSYDQYEAYSTSKLALTLYCLDLSKRLLETGVVVNLVHPGWIRTKLAKEGLHDASLASRIRSLAYLSSPARGAESVIYLATDPEARTFNGAYIIKKEKAPLSSVALDTKLQAAVVEKTKEVLAPYLR